MLPKRESRSLILTVDLVAKIVGPLVKDLDLYPIRGNHEELQDPWDNFLEVHKE